METVKVESVVNGEVKDLANDISSFNRSKVEAKEIHPAIEQVLFDFRYKDNLGYYAFFLGYVDFYRSEEIQTACVTIHNFKLAFKWNKDFFDNLSYKEVKFLVIHELFHLLFNHIERDKHYTFDHRQSNWIQDAIINHLITKNYNGIADMPKKPVSEIILEQRKSLDAFAINPTNFDFARSNSSELQNFNDEQIYEHYKNEIDLLDIEMRALYGDIAPVGVLLDSHYKDALIYEKHYLWLDDIKAEYYPLDKDGRKKYNKIDTPTKWFLNSIEYGGDSKMGVGSGMDSHDELEPQNEAEEKLIKQMIDDVKETLKQRGHEKGGHEMLNELCLEKRPNNLKYLKQVIGAMKGTQIKRTFRKPNKKVDLLKGRKKIGLEINVILDTSGSMFGDFDNAISEVFKDGYVINLVQVDTAVESVTKIKNKNELKKFAIKGGGGTCLQPAVDYIKDGKNRLNKYPTVLLTDGYTDTLNFPNNDFMIISCHVECPISSQSCKVQQIIIQK